MITPRLNSASIAEIQPRLVALAALFAYLYFILNLEDYALIAGSTLLFVLLAAVMYMTRNTDWFSLGKRE